MSYVENWNCPQCNSRNLFCRSTDGNIGHCEACGTRAIRHACHKNSALDIGPDYNWLPIVITGIGVVCPNCKLTYQIAEEIRQSPESPDWLKGLAALAGMVAVAVGVAMIAEAIEESLPNS